MVIEWTAPADGGSAITSYTVQIRQIDGSTFTIYDGCTGVAITCTVPISALIATPYSLGHNNLVRAKVKATNAVGSSDYSPEGTGA